MLLALLVATGAAPAPPYLAGLDRRRHPRDTSALTLIVIAFVAAAL